MTTLNRVALGLLLAITASGQVDPVPGPAVPILLQSALPIYPPIWRAAHISGKVAVLVNVKGGRVVEADVQSGDSHLARPTVSNIKTWRFGKNVGGTFNVTYIYEISGEPSDEATNPLVEVLPSLDVKITARPVKPTVNYGR